MYKKQWCRAGKGLKLLAHVKRFTPEFTWGYRRLKIMKWW